MTPESKVKPSTPIKRTRIKVQGVWGYQEVSALLRILERCKPFLVQSYAENQYQWPPKDRAMKTLAKFQAGLKIAAANLSGSQ